MLTPRARTRLRNRLLKQPRWQMQPRWLIQPRRLGSPPSLSRAVCANRLENTLVAHQNVGGLEVRMHKPEPVHVGQSIEHTSQDVPHP